MLKRVLSLCLALAMVFSFVCMAHAAEEDVTLKLHYHRPDGAYDGWDVWLWLEGKDGGGFPLSEEGGDMVATYTFKPSTAQIGFIVRQGGDSWSGKDISEDQFISVAGITAGTVHVYVESGVPGYKMVFGDDAVYEVAVVSAKYDGGTGISLVMNAQLPADSSFVIRLKGEDVATPTVSADGTNVQLTLAEKLNPTKQYTVVFNDKEYDIEMPDFYTSPEFEADYTYTGSDLGATYTKEQTVLRLWAPTANAVKVNLYANGDPAAQAKPDKQVDMTADACGTWVATLPGNCSGTYYTYTVEFDNGSVEACDPYARTTGVNGHRAMILDLAATNPEGWENDKDPNRDNAMTDNIIYELHIRDLSSDSSSGIQNVGKYLGLIESGTKNAAGIPTGLDHMKDLGITHLHLLPMYDYGSVDESKLDTNQFNWGYDPVNYNVPEGSYSTDPYNGAVRVQEMKRMVKGLHDNGISVVMDVVYNHVQDAGSFCFNKIVPGYFSRPNSNGSGCGNDTASERLMVSKYIVDSVKYWADEYHIDGFRFDLVGLIDIDTINTIVEEVHKTHPNVIFYGEGWTMTTAPTKPGILMATQSNSNRTPGFAYFSDTIRNALKGSVFGTKGKGYVSGAPGKAEDIIRCFMGSPIWCSDPTQIINYASCHDNNTLIDHIAITTTTATREDQVKMNNLAAAIYMTSQGVPFMQAGEEFLRSKPKAIGGYEENSYMSPDSVNSLKWDTLSTGECANTYEYYKGLIAFRKAHPVLRLTKNADVQKAISSVSGLDENVTAFHIDGSVANDPAKELFLVFNPNPEATTVTLPAGNWAVCVNGEKAGTDAMAVITGEVQVSPISATMLVWTEESPKAASSASTPWGVIAGVGAAIAAAAAAAVVLTRKKKQ